MPAQQPAAAPPREPWSKNPVLMDKSVQDIAERLAYLKGRWADESQYEDFREYVTNVKTVLPPGAADVKLTRNFVLTFKLGGRVVEFRCRTYDCSYIERILP